jgi:hypothetical protein
LTNGVHVPRWIHAPQIVRSVDRTLAILAAITIWLASPLAAAGPPLASAGPITFFTTLQVSTGDLFLLDITNPAGVTVSSPTEQGHGFSLGETLDIGYGVTSKLQLFALIPWFVHKSLSQTSLDGHETSSGSNGFGDTLFLARYTLLDFEHAESALRIAPIVGLKTPTVISDTGFSKIPRPLQPGSGTWDPLGGLTLVWQTLDWEFDADAGYRINTTADHFRFGNEVFADGSVQYRLWPFQIGTGNPGFIYVTLDSNFIQQGKNRINERADSNSGGHLWFLDPGVQYVTERYALKAAAQLPAITGLNGNALSPDYGVFVCVRLNVLPW